MGVLQDANVNPDTSIWVGRFLRSLFIADGE